MQVLYHKQKIVSIKKLKYTKMILCSRLLGGGSTSSPTVVRQAHQPWFDRLTNRGSAILAKAHGVCKCCARSNLRRRVGARRRLVALAMEAKAGTPEGRWRKGMMAGISRDA